MQIWRMRAWPAAAGMRTLMRSMRASKSHAHMMSMLAAESLMPYIKPDTVMAICSTVPERVEPSTAEQQADTRSVAATTWCGSSSESASVCSCWRRVAYPPHTTVAPSLARRFCMTAPPSTPCDRSVWRSKKSSEGPNAPHIPPLTTMIMQ